MPTNTGFKQATIAFKVTKPGGLPLDINGELCSVSGLKQAIYLITGAANPDPSLYDVEGYFTPDSVISGNSTINFDPTSCPVGLINITPTTLVLLTSGPLGTATLYSSHPWTFVSGPAIAALSQTTGVAGYTYLEFTPNATEGQGDFIFRNNVTLQTATIYVVNAADPSLWVLTGGTWHDLGFWTAGGIWTY